MKINWKTAVPFFSLFTLLGVLWGYLGPDNLLLSFLLGFCTAHICLSIFEKAGIPLFETKYQ